MSRKKIPGKKIPIVPANRRQDQILGVDQRPDTEIEGIFLRT